MGRCRVRARKTHVGVEGYTSPQKVVTSREKEVEVIFLGDTLGTLAFPGQMSGV